MDVGEVDSFGRLRRQGDTSHSPSPSRRPRERDRGRSRSRSNSRDRRGSPPRHALKPLEFDNDAGFQGRNDDRRSGAPERET
eukprot:2075338-Pleurochrysis_carterae.AAC.2